MDCTARHTNFQPSDEGWRCPKCHLHASDPNNPDEWAVTILERASGSTHGCESLHEMDELKCHSCGWSGYGDEFSKMLLEQMTGQDQRSVKEQIQELVGIATKHKMYDAADYLKRELERWGK